MPRNVTMTTSFILNYVVNLLNAVGSKEELPERGSELQEELMGFYQVLESFDAMLDGIPDVQAYFVNCCDLCIQLRTQDDWKSDEVKARIPTAIHILRTCRMALFIEFFWRMLHNTIATPKISLGFTQAIQDILACLDYINKFEKADTPIQQPTRSLISHYREMTSYNFSLKSMDEIAASEESQMIICSPEEVFSPTDLQIFEQHIKEIVIRRKSAITSGVQPIESTLRLTVFLKELSAQENSVIQLERSFIFTDMELLKPDSVFSLFGVYLTNGTSTSHLTFAIGITN
ncbi:hypothetical protein DL95DRAFT_418372 [Leptodontidium sp. 2 PMI_412]|nr:hypothetical protein DL95DRAFT_418372 [Leptodontidium sp. 2 PMI_412]